MRRALFLLCLSLLVIPRPARAIPAFARRYETSCQTCHVAYPKLTPFGEAFRWNGYRFPEGGDASSEKVPPVELGNEAQKERWPKVVFPGAIPGDVPISIVLSGTLGYGSEFETHGHGGSEHTEMAGMDTHEETGTATGTATGTGTGAEDEHAEEAEDEHHAATLDASTLVDMFGLRAAGTLGDHVAFLTAVNLGGAAVVDVERASVIFTPFRRPTDLRIKVGAFEPELHGVTIHRGLLGHMLRLTTRTFGDSAWSPDPTKLGLELSGIAGHRFGWAVAGVENATPGVYLAKDAYGRVFYKIGGMPADGSGTTSATAAWRDRTILLGISAYNGRAQIATDDAIQDDPFTRVGADLHTTWDDLSLDLVAAREWHDSPYAGDSTNGFVDRGFAELTWVVLPVVFPTLRFEAAQETVGDEAPGGLEWLGVVSVNGVLRPNVLLRAEVATGADAGDHADFRFASLAYSAAF